MEGRDSLYVFSVRTKIDKQTNLWEPGPTRHAFRSDTLRHNHLAHTLGCSCWSGDRCSFLNKINEKDLLLFILYIYYYILIRFISSWLVTLKKIWRLLGKLRTGCNSIPSSHMFLYIAKARKKTLIWNLLSLRFKQVRFFFLSLSLKWEEEKKKKVYKNNFSSWTRKKTNKKRTHDSRQKAVWEAFFPIFFWEKELRESESFWLFFFSFLSEEQLPGWSCQ